MITRKAAAPARRITPDEAAALVKPGMWLDYGAVLAQPDAFDTALARRQRELSDVGIRSCLSMRPRAVLEGDPTANAFTMVSLHASGYDRKMCDAGLISYMPVNLGEIPDYYRRFIDPVDMVILKTCPVDKDGVFNFGPSATWSRAIIERARLVIVEECRSVPVALGAGNGVHISEVDFIIEGDHAALPELPSPPPSDIDRAVAQRVVDEIESGSCLQIGIGVISDAACSMLVASDVQDLGIHTEMLTEGLIDLYKAGKITGARKTRDTGKHVYAFTAGSRLLYDAVDRNTDFECLPVDYTNMPHIIMQNDRVAAINNTTQIDLTGQAASESDGHRHLTGTGGQAQFVRGAYASSGGKSFICLASTYERGGDRRSRIVLSLTPGNAVTTTRADMMYVVTEYGIANLKGKSVAERARALIGLAHPDFREGLERDAYTHGLIPRGFFPTAPAIASAT